MALTTASAFPRLRLSALCCLILLIGQTLAVALPSPPADGTPLFAQELLSDRIVICTTAGLVVIDRRTGELIVPDDRANDGRHDGDQANDHAGTLCLFCLPILHGNTHTPTPVELPAPDVRSVLSETPVFTAALPPGRPTGVAWPRGPPAARST